MKENKSPSLIIKSGATDLRRGVKRLFTDIITKINDPKKGNTIAYANKPKTTVKLVQEKPKATVMVTMHYKEPVEWPEYKYPDEKNHTVTLTGNEKDKFLKDRHCPKEL
jgi:hypothetical protein